MTTAEHNTKEDATVAPPRGPGHHDGTRLTSEGAQEMDRRAFSGGVEALNMMTRRKGKNAGDKTLH